MTFPEYLRERATWFDRLLCLVFGHSRRGAGYSPLDTREDRELARRQSDFCRRCGKSPVDICHQCDRGEHG